MQHHRGYRCGITVWVSPLAAARNNRYLHIDNGASLRVPEKCGLKWVANFIYNNELPCNWLRITKEDWERMRHML